MADTHIHIHLNGEGEAVTPEKAVKKASRVSRPTKARKTKTKAPARRKDPKMAKAMKQAHAVAKKKDGSWKKGWNQGKMMSHAHKLKRKM